MPRWKYCRNPKTVPSFLKKIHSKSGSFNIEVASTRFAACYILNAGAGQQPIVETCPLNC